MGFALLVLSSLLLICVQGQPVFFDITNSTQYIDLEVNVTNPTGYDWTALQYGLVKVPAEAYLVNITVKNATCQWSNSTATLTGLAPSFVFCVSRTMPCSQLFQSSAPLDSSYSEVMCNSIGHSVPLSDKGMFCEQASGYSTLTQIVSVDRYDHTYSTDLFHTTTNGLSRGTGIALAPNSELWAGVGFMQGVPAGIVGYTSEQCSFELTAEAYQCPTGTIPISNNATALQPICVQAAKVPLISDTTQTRTFSQNQAVFVLDNMPFNASYVMINISIPFSGITAAPLASAGSYFAASGATAAATGTYASSVASALDCGLISSQNTTDSATYINFYFVCYAPTWNTSFYVSIDASNTSASGSSYNVSTYVSTCPAGYSGMSCSDALVPIDLLTATSQYNIILPVTLSASAAASAHGYQHYYFDVPVGSWNATLIELKAFIASQDTSTSVLAPRAVSLRRNSYSAQSGALGGAGLPNSLNPVESSCFANPSGVISTPYERFSTSEDTRWVITLSCSAISAAPACNISLNITLYTSTIDYDSISSGPTSLFAVPSTPPPAPVPVAPTPVLAPQTPVAPPAPISPPPPAPTPSQITPSSSCAGTAPTGSFYCTNLGWTLSNTSIDTPSGNLSVSGATVILSGDLTVASLLITGLSSNLTIVSGCANISQQVSLSLSSSDVNLISASGGVLPRQVLAEQSASCTTALSSIPVSVSVPPDSCNSATSSSDSTSLNTLVVTLSLDSSGCKKTSSWLIPVIVVCAVAGLAIIVGVIFTVAKNFKRVARPFSVQGRYKAASI